MKKYVICLVGPSGVGKTAICDELTTKNNQFQKIRTATTREKRKNEDENAYFFLTKEEFAKGQSEGIFLESAEYAGEMYGTPKCAVDAIIEDNKIAVVPVEMSGAKAYKEFYGDMAIIVFVYRDKRTTIESIMERNISLTEKSKRIMQLDKEYENLTHCERCVINNGSLAEAAEVVKSFVLN